MKVGGPDGGRLSHDHPAAAKNIFPHLRHVYSTLKTRSLSLVAAGPGEAKWVFVKNEVQYRVKWNRANSDLEPEIRPANVLLAVTAILRPGSNRMGHRVS
jgi:hypothetical protein